MLAQGVRPTSNWAILSHHYPTVFIIGTPLLRLLLLAYEMMRPTALAFGWLAILGGIFILDNLGKAVAGSWESRF